MSNRVIMSYGGIDISPVPVISIRRDNKQVSNRADPIGYNFTMSLNGTLTSLPNDGGLISTDQLMEDLRATFNADGKLLLIQCGPEGGPYTDVMSIYPKIQTINFAESNNNWVDTIPYTIELAFDQDENNDHPSSEIPPFIEDYSEEWNVEFVQDQKYFVFDLSQVTDQVGGYDYSAHDSNNPFEARVTHNVTVKGKQSWSGTGIYGDMTTGVENALDWALNTFAGFGYSGTYGHALSGWTNLGSSKGTAYDHFRTHVVNETDGSVTLNESWIVLGNNTGINTAGRAMTEDLTIEIRTGVDDGLTRVSINGSINGVASMSYSPSNLATNVSTSAYEHAASGWNEVADRILPRAQLLYQQHGASRRLHPTPLSKSISHSPNKGIIGYAYEFNDRPCAFVTGALSESFTITDNHPSDVFAKLSVLGRAAGPVLQEISTVTESTREISLEAVFPPPTGCSSISSLDQYKPTTNVENLLCEFETQLTSTYDQVFKNSDNESWSPLSGRYSRTVSWTYQSCSGTPSTSFC